MATHMTESTGASVTATHKFTTGTLEIQGTATFKVDVIAESTAANGITVDGVTCKDGGVTPTSAIAVSSGGTGSGTTTTALSNLGAATRGANSDITSITGLTTPLDETLGGTGLTTFNQYDIFYGGGADTMAALATGTSGQALFSVTGGYEWREATAGVQASVPAGTKMLVYADSAPSGWTLETDFNDQMVIVSVGSGLGGDTGGTTVAASTWTQPNHTHTGPNHNHQWSDQGGGSGADQHWLSNGTKYTPTPTNKTASVFHYLASTSTDGFVAADLYVANGGTGDTGGGATVATWRPKAHAFILCSKD